MACIKKEYVKKRVIDGILDLAAEAGGSRKVCVISTFGGFELN